MSPEDRRTMLVAATLPLLSRHGMKVTTKQIAEAAGVAEGTIFRVFPDKDALVQAATAQALDVEPTLAALAAVDMGLPLRERLASAVRILQRHFVAIFDLMIALRRFGPPADIEEHRAAQRPRHAAVLAAVERILAPDRAEFRCPVEDVVRILRLLTFSGSHPLITDGRLLTADEITTVLLDGVLQHHATEHAHDHERGQSRC
jgi:AcrR family transcriptional regulator